MAGAEGSGQMAVAAQAKGGEVQAGAAQSMKTVAAALNRYAARAGEPVQKPGLKGKMALPSRKLTPAEARELKEIQERFAAMDASMGQQNGIESLF